MENSELESSSVDVGQFPALLPSAPTANARAWWQSSVWWAASAVILTLAIVNVPTAWVGAAGYEGIYLSLACCGTGLVAAQLFILAFAIGCTEESWLRQLTRAYPVFLIICATVAGGLYWGAQWKPTPFGRAMGEMTIRRDIGGTLLLMVEVQAIFIIVVVLMRGQYQARFVHQGMESAPESPWRWTLRDMLLWTSYAAATLAIVRFMPWYLDDNDRDNLFLSGFCTFIAGLMLAFLTTGAALEFFAHFPPSAALWKRKYSLFLAMCLAALVVIDASGMLFEYETALFKMLIAFLAYCNGIALSFLALESCGWRLMISTLPRTGKVEEQLRVTNRR